MTMREMFDDLERDFDDFEALEPAWAAAADAGTGGGVGEG